MRSVSAASGSLGRFVVRSHLRPHSNSIRASPVPLSLCVFHLPPEPSTSLRKRLKGTETALAAMTSDYHRAVEERDALRSPRTSSPAPRSDASPNKLARDADLANKLCHMQQELKEAVRACSRAAPVAE